MGLSVAAWGALACVPAGRRPIDTSPDLTHALSTPSLSPASLLLPAAYSPYGELQAAGLGDRFLASWPEDRLGQLQLAGFSSTVREVLCPRLLLQSIDAQAPHLLPGQRVQYQCDSQPATGAVNGQKGTPSVYAEVRLLLEFCKQRDIELEVVWYPRSNPAQQYADDLSKQPDPSQWRLSEPAYALICSELRLTCKERRTFT